MQDSIDKSESSSASAAIPTSTLTSSKRARSSEAAEDEGGDGEVVKSARLGVSSTGQEGSGYGGGNGGNGGGVESDGGDGKSNGESDGESDGGKTELPEALFWKANLRLSKEVRLLCLVCRACRWKDCV